MFQVLFDRSKTDTRSEIMQNVKKKKKFMRTLWVCLSAKGK